MYLAILVLPLLSFLVCGVGGRFLGGRGAAALSTFFISLTSFLSFFICYEVVFAGSSTYLKFQPWISTFQMSWGFLFDPLTVIILVMVTFVSALVHLYASEYMKEDPHLPRFMGYLSLFTFCMEILVTADNFIQLFVGWEGVGIVSYLLINFWFTRIQATKSAMKAVIVNRIGDLGFTLAMVAFYSGFKTFDFATIFSLVPYWSLDHSFQLNFVAFFLLLGAVGKSAQLGLHIWLPDAMEGPTPVSALIHAATMVTAGVFLILRTSLIFEYAPLVLNLVTIIGALTLVFAATTAIFQRDLKKVIAYSTCSQLGYMICGCGVSQYSLSFFHLINHGFFKALLFLGAGAVIHGLSDEQDMRRMGSLFPIFPLTAVLFLVGSFSLIGFPFLTGFYSKESLLEVLKSQSTNVASFAYFLGTLSALFTAFYSFGLIFLTFLGKANWNKKVVERSHEPSAVMLIPLILLAIPSVFLGYVLKDMFLGLGTQFWDGSLVTLSQNQIFVEAEFLPWYIKIIPVLGSFLGLVFALVCVARVSEFFLIFNFLGIYQFFTKKWYFDKIIHQMSSFPLLSMGYHVTFKLIDRGVLEFWGPFGISERMKDYSRDISFFQTGVIYHYALLMIVALTFYLAFFLGDFEFMTLFLPLVLAFFYAS